MRRENLGFVELQLVVGDPPGLLGLQPLCSLLLHVVLLQPVRLDQLLKAQLTVTAKTLLEISLNDVFTTQLAAKIELHLVSKRKSFAEIY